MSMTAATALTSVKNRLDLVGNTDFDTVLADFISAAVGRLFPRAGAEVDPQTVSVSPDSYGEVNIVLSTLPTPIADSRQVEGMGTGAWFPIDSKYVHNKTLRLRDVPSYCTSVRIYGLNRFTLHATVPANTTIPEELEMAVIWYAMSEFYENLTGNKRKYNIYMQTTGARGVDNMRDEAIYYEQKADAYVEEQAGVYGSQ
jgi:hypothetical protein